MACERLSPVPREGLQAHRTAHVVDTQWVVLVSVHLEAKVEVLKGNIRKLMKQNTKDFDAVWKVYVEHGSEECVLEYTLKRLDTHIDLMSSRTAPTGYESLSTCVAK